MSKAKSKIVQKAGTDWWYVKSEDGFRVVVGKGISVPSFPDIPFFVYHEKGLFAFCEGRTGLSLSSESTENKAINEACEILTRMGYDEIKRYIEESLKDGEISPRFK